MQLILVLILAVALYLASGRFWWRRIVSPGPAPQIADMLADRPTDEGHWRADLTAAEARGHLACLIPKATFIMLWPLALSVGWLSARL